jgi:hypothetical protein
LLFVVVVVVVVGKICVHRLHGWKQNLSTNEWTAVDQVNLDRVKENSKTGVVMMACKP